MKKLVYGMMFLVLSGILNLSSADDLVGYWSKSQVVDRSHDEVRVYLQVKELIKADVENNKFTVKVKEMDLAGRLQVERKEVVDRFVTPTNAANSVKRCVADGHTFRLRLLGSKNIETCEIKNEARNRIITIAAVPFGVFEFSKDFMMQLPDGRAVEAVRTTKLISFGKK